MKRPEHVGVDPLDPSEVLPHVPAHRRASTASLNHELEHGIIDAVIEKRSGRWAVVYQSAGGAGVKDSTTRGRKPRRPLPYSQHTRPSSRARSLMALFGVCERLLSLRSRPEGANGGRGRPDQEIARRAVLGAPANTASRCSSAYRSFSARSFPRRDTKRQVLRPRGVKRQTPVLPKRPRALYFGLGQRALVTPVREADPGP